VRSIGAGVVDFVGQYSGFGNYIAYHLTGGPLKGQEIYTAEFATPTVVRGQRIRSGQQIGVAGSSIEAGFAQKGPTYLPLAQTSGGYSEGQPTQQGRRFRALMTGAPQPATNTLGQLWIQAGGAPKLANIMAAIALAESGGQVDAKGGPNTDGSYDYGLWQINSSHRSYDPAQLLSDPLYNARAAVAVYRSQGLSAWTTYNTGAYRSFLTGASRTPVGGTGKTRPGGEPTDPGAASSDAQDIAWYDYLNPLHPDNVWWDPFGIVKKAEDGVHSADDFMHWIAWIFHPRNILRVVEFLVGMTLLMAGVVFAYRDTQRGGGRQFPRGRGGGLFRQAASTVEKVTPTGRAVRAASKSSRIAQAGEGSRRVERAAAAEGRREEAHATRIKTEKARATELRTRGGRRPKKYQSPFTS
jgi:hypothetical protein